MSMLYIQNRKLFLHKLRIKVADPNIATIMVKNKAKNKPFLPKIIRDELRFTVALQGCSYAIQGKGRTMKSQYDQMLMFYQGQELHHPSQIQLLCDCTVSYRNMHDSTQSKVNSKSKDQSSAFIVTLKITLTLDINANYRCGQQIAVSYLRRKTVNDPLLATGQ